MYHISYEPRIWAVLPGENKALPTCYDDRLCEVRRISSIVIPAPIDKAIEFIKTLFDYEIQTIQSKKTQPDTGYPVDIIVIKPDSYYFSDIKNPTDAIIK